MVSGSNCRVLDGVAAVTRLNKLARNAGPLARNFGMPSLSKAVSVGDHLNSDKHLRKRRSFRLNGHRVPRRTLGLRCLVCDSPFLNDAVSLDSNERARGIRLFRYPIRMSANHHHP